MPFRDPERRKSYDANRKSVARRDATQAQRDQDAARKRDVRARQRAEGSHEHPLILSLDDARNRLAVEAQRYRDWAVWQQPVYEVGEA